MHGLRNMLVQEQARLEQMISKINEDQFSELDGYLRISNDKGKCRYYHCLNDRNGTYITGKNENLIKKLAQKTYNISVLKKAEHRLKQITKITKDYSDDEIENLYTSLHKDRMKLIVPVEQPWNQLVEKWHEQEYAGKEFKEGTPVILTERGERVRSKSEKMLADYFDKRRIAYKYEKPLYLKGHGTVYPDFTFLSPKTRQEIYWEHDGRMDDPDYARKAIRKIETYEKNGILPGKNLILTFETSQSILDMKVVEKLTKEYLIIDNISETEGGIFL